MMPRKINSIDKRVLIVGIPKSGKHSLLAALTTAGQTNFNSDVRNFYKEATQTVKILPPDYDYERKLFTLMDAIQQENKIIKMVFCLDPTDFFTTQLNSLQTILEHAKGLKQKIEYIIYVSKVDVLNKGDVEILEINIARIVGEFLPSIPQPREIIYSDKNLVPPLMQVQLLIQSLNKLFHIEIEDKCENALPGQYSVADDKQEPTVKQKHLNHFLQVFPTLEHEQPSIAEIVSIKQSIISHTEYCLDELKRIIIVQDNYKFSFSDFTLFFDTVKNSDILKIHQNKTLEKLGVINILGTQQKLLKLIRAAALNAFDEDLQITLIANSAKAYDPMFYDSLLALIDDAKKLELFASHRSNLPRLFLPSQTDSCKQLDNIKQTILTEQNSHRERYQDQRRRLVV
jgi:hypothetical protein